ncbi:MAG: acetyl-CoA hydrolase [Myxococcaceae bacterium]|nr:acetyl-CoA hydrolase [Myxococcaceae bacterium]
MAATYASQVVQDPDACIERVLERVGSKIVLGTPLGIGKPNALLNALYRRAKADPSIQLDIITALSLNAPFGKSELEERFYRPIRRRVWDHVPRLAYLDDSDANTLPANVRLIEFYTRAGSILRNPTAQQNYISSNYTHIARDMMSRGVNLLMQAVAVREVDGQARYSFAGNPDVSVELLQRIEQSGREVVIVAQVNRGLPWFGHACEVSADRLHYIVDDPALDHVPFAVPHEPIDPTAWAIGLRAAGLVRDGGTLQVGIGALGDAACHALRIRQREAFTFSLMLDALRRDPLVAELGGDEEFKEGLYVASELISNPLFALFEEGIVRRRVYDDPELQRLSLEAPSRLPAGARGTTMQGAFFVGPADFYKRLSELPDERRELIDMNSVAEVNRIYTHYTLEHLQRKHARFLNMTLNVTLLGAAASDQLRDGKVLSGVGGQSDFVNMGHQLPDGRSILLFRATSQRGSKLESNVVWEYGHTTIPRHMRDLFVTEYGVADLRGKTDSECIEAMLSIADSRFQEDLLEQAKRAGKVKKDTRIPEAFRNNLPERIARALTPFRDQDALPELPFGSDLTPAEWALGARLKKLAAASADSRGKARLMRAMSSPASADEPEVQAALQHLELAEPDNTKERLLARLVRAAYRL